MNEELKVIISAEVAKLKKGMEDAKKQVSSFKEQVEKASANVDANFKKAGEVSATALKGMATAAGAAGAALLGMSAATTEYRENQAKLATAFKDADDAAATAKETYNDLYRVMGDGDAATEAAQSLARLTTEEKALGEYTTALTGIYATYGDGMPIETIAEAVAETAACGTVTGDLSRALVEAGVSEDAFNEKLAACNNEAEREKLIRKTLNDLYSDAAAQYEENNAAVLAQRDAQARLQETMAEVGAAVAPVVTAFTSFASDALAVVAPYIQQLAENYAPALQSALQGVADALGVAMGFLADNWEIVASVAGVLSGIVAAIGLYNTVAAVKAAMDAAQVTTLWGLVSAYAAQAAAMAAALAPYLAIVAAVAAVIAIIVLCVKHWDEIKAKVAEVWADIKAKTLEAVENVKEKILELVTAAKEKFEEMKAAVSEKMEAAKNAVREKFEAVRSAVSEKASAAKEAAANKFEEMKGAVSEKVNAAKSAVSGAFDNIRSAVSDKVSAAKAAAVNAFEGIRSGVKEKIDAARSAVSSAIDKIKSIMNFSWSLPKLKMPSISISGKFSLNPLSVPKFSISWNALGGVFDSPTLFSYGNSLQGLGENGAEAVVPLEKNTYWLDRIAEMLTEKQAKTPIFLQVDGKTFAEISIDSINQLTKQTGTLPLVLA